MTSRNKSYNVSGTTARIFDIIQNMSEEEKERLVPLLGEKRREHVRKPYIVAVDYETENGSYHGYIMDISVGGVFIETNESLTIGQELLLSLSFRNLQKPFKVTGKVVRKTPQGVGMKFEGLTQRQLDTLASVVREI